MHQKTWVVKVGENEGMKEFQLPVNQIHFLHHSAAVVKTQTTGKTSRRYDTKLDLERLAQYRPVARGVFLVYWGLKRELFGIIHYLARLTQAHLIIYCSALDSRLLRNTSLVCADELLASLITEVGRPRPIFCGCGFLEGL